MVPVQVNLYTLLLALPSLIPPMAKREVEEVDTKVKSEIAEGKFGPTNRKRFFEKQGSSAVFYK